MQCQCADVFSIVRYRFFFQNISRNTAKMRLLILIASCWALVASKPEMYKEKEDFQYSRSSSDDGTKSGFYGAQRGNMGGNYERSHNMDSLAQHHMSTLVRNVDGELGEAVNTRTGSVYSSANSRGLYGSGNYDLSNLRGRHFGEAISGDSLSQSALSQNSGYSDYSGYGNLYSAANKYSSSQAQNSGLSSGYQTSGLASQYSQTDAQKAVDNIYSASNYNYATTEANKYEYAQSSNQAQSNYEHSNSDSGYDYKTRNSLTYATPVRVYIKPGTRVAIPVAAQVYDAAAIQGINTVHSDSEIFGTTGQRIQYYKPTNNAKHYESSYNYRKEWEKHGSIPVTVAPTESPIPANSELYEDAQLSQTANNQYGSELASAVNSQSSSANRAYLSGYSASTKNALSSQSQHQSRTYNSGTSASNAYNYGTGVSNAYNSGSSASNAYKSGASDTNAYTHNAYDASLAANLHGSHISDGTANSNNFVEDIASRPKSYQSSYSYHKSWERRGDPYVIKPVGGDLTSQKLILPTCTYCLDESQQRVRRSINNKYHQSDNLYDGQEDMGQQSMSGWEQDLTELGQQTQNKWDELQSFNQQPQNQFGNLEDLGQQTQNQWDKLEDLGQQPQSHWGKLEDLGQQIQDKLEDLGQQTQSPWGKLEDLGQQTQDKLEDLGQQKQSHWGKLEDLGQQTQDKLEDLGQQKQSHWGKLEDLGQQTQDKLEDLGQQTQSHWGKLEDLGQQTQDKLEDLGQQTQSHWGKLEDLGQHTQDKFEDFGQQPQSHWGKLEDLGQQTQDKLEDLGQQTQSHWGKLEDLGQQTQDKLEDLGQQTQSHWGKLEDLGQQTQDKLEDLGQQTQSHWGKLEDLGQQTQDKLEDLGQQTQSHWGKLEDLGQQTQHKLEDLGQQTQSHWGKLEDLGQQTQHKLEDLGQQTQSHWGKLEDLGQQTQHKLEDLGQQTQSHWGKIEDLGQQTQHKFEDLGQQTQSHWGKLEDLGQQTQHKLEDLGQQTQNQWDNLGDLTRQTHSHWGKLEDLGQQTLNQWDKLGNFNQQAQSHFGNSDHLGQQTQLDWGKLEDLGQQTQSHWSKLDLDQHTQSKWDNLENVGQQSHKWSHFDNLGQQENLGHQGQTWSVANSQGIQNTANHYGGYQFYKPWTAAGSYVPYHTNYREVPGPYYVQESQENINKRWNCHNLEHGSYFHNHNFDYKDSQGATHNSDFSFNIGGQDHSEKPKENTAQHSEGKLRPKIDTNIQRETTTIKYVTLGNQIPEKTQKTINTDKVQEKNTSLANIHPIDIGRGDIGPEDISIEIANMNENNNYKTPEEIESLSLTKDQRDISKDPLNLSVTDLNQQSEPENKQNLWNKLSTVIESVTTSTAKPKESLENNMNFIPIVDNYTPKSNFFITSNNAAFNEKQNESKQILVSDDQQEFFIQKNMKNLEPFEEQIMVQQLEPFEKQNLGQQSEPLEEQYNGQQLENFEWQNWQQQMHSFDQQYIAQNFEPLEKQMKPHEKQNIEQIETSQKFVGQLQNFDKTNSRHLDFPVEQTVRMNSHGDIAQVQDFGHISADRNILQNSQTSSKQFETSPENKYVQQQSEPYKSHNVELSTNQDDITPIEPSTEKPGFWGSVWNKTKSAKDSVISWFHS